MVKKKADSKPARLRITQVRSGVGKPGGQRATLRALGLKHHQDSVIQPDNPAIRGMVFQVQHLVAVSELGEGEE
ncbi:MAG: 50S ribosomal protein L30 [Longimicrobiales bacterium]